MRKTAPWIAGLIASALLIALVLGALASPTAGNSLPNSLVAALPGDKLSVAFMNLTDLPLGWRDRRAKALELPDGKGRTVAYFAVDPRKDPIINVSQTVIVYADETQSRANYLAAVAEAFPQEVVNQYIRPDALDFQGHWDEMAVGCLPGHSNDIPFHACKVVARYKDMVLQLRGSVFEDRWLTMAQFRHLFERVDLRMQAASER